MATMFYTRSYGRFMEIKSKHMRKTLNKTNQPSYSPGGGFSNRDNVRDST